MTDRRTQASSAALWGEVADRFSSFLEIDEAMIPVEDWDDARAGDKMAVARIQARLHGVVLYEHAFGPPPSDWVRVSLRELARIGAINAVKLSHSIDAA